MATSMKDAMASPDDGPPEEFACVWDALMDTPAEAAAMRIRSDMLSAIQQAVKGWNPPRTAAAQWLEVTRPRLDDLMHGRIGKFSFDDLILLATWAGLDMRVQIDRISA